MLEWKHRHLICDLVSVRGERIEFHVAPACCVRDWLTSLCLDTFDNIMDMTGNKYRCCFGSAVFIFFGTIVFFVIETSDHLIYIALLLPVGLCLCDSSFDRIIGWEGRSMNRQQGLNRFSRRQIKHTDAVRPVALQPYYYHRRCLLGKCRKTVYWIDIMWFKCIAECYSRWKRQLFGVAAFCFDKLRCSWERGKKNFAWR